MRNVLLVLMIIASVCVASTTQAAPRFPQPEFDTGYEIPEPTTPPPEIYEYLDVTLLVIALVLATFLTLKHRRRAWVFVLMVACVAYFGFWRKGCVCPVGSLQNTVLAISSRKELTASDLFDGLDMWLPFDLQL